MRPSGLPYRMRVTGGRGGSITEVNDVTTEKDMRGMKTGELAEEARRTGIKNIEQMNKSQLMDAVNKGRQQQPGRQRQARSSRGRSR